MKQKIIEEIVDEEKEDENGENLVIFVVVLQLQHLQMAQRT